MEKASYVFEFLEQMTRTDESKVFYVLVVLCIVMIADFVLGTAAAWVNPSIRFESAEGINGIIRKVGTLLLFVICIPLSVLIPGHAGVAALYVLYTGYLVMEMASVVENLRKLGVRVEPLEAFARMLGANRGADIKTGEKKEDKNE